MKNQYFGDINDFLKYGLLRCFANVGLRVGVCWMMTGDDRRSDGRKIEYLSTPERWRPHDPTLFDCLAGAIRTEARNVRYLERSGILTNASFCSARVPDREPSRKLWLTKALGKLRGVDLLFFDPDNGIEVQSMPSGKTGSCKYLYWDEIQRAWAQGSSLLIFQHFPRQEREQYISRLASELARRVSGGKVIPLVTSNVVYLLACQPAHEMKAGIALDEIATRWRGQIRGRKLHATAD